MRLTVFCYVGNWEQRGTVAGREFESQSTSWKIFVFIGLTLLRTVKTISWLEDVEKGVTVDMEVVRMNRPDRKG